MRNVFPLIITCSVLLIGCSKTEDSTEVTTDPGNPSAPAAKPTGKASPKLTAELSAVEQKIEQKNYDAAIASLLQAQQAAQSEADQLELRKKMVEAGDALSERAQSDPKAREAYQHLGRIMTGR